MLRRGEGNRPLGLLWGGVALALVVLSPLGPTLARVLPACLAKSTFGIPCPTCGTSRSALALARLDLPAALAVSPLATLAWITLVGGGLVAGAVALLGYGPPERPLRSSLGLRIGLVVLIAVNWIYLVWSGA